MIPEIGALYNQALKRPDLSWWLGDKDFIKDYKDILRFLSDEQEQLTSALSGHELEVFQRYMENQDCKTDLEGQMQFSQGFAIGLRLGSLCAWG